MTHSPRNPPTSRGSGTAVGIPTYKRPQALERLLRALSPQVLSNAAQIIVVDNDPEGSARAIAQAFPDVQYHWEPTPGVAYARNRLLREAGAYQVLALIDDDELPADTWLTNLLAHYRSSSANLIAAPVISVLPPEAPAWAHHFFERPRRPTGPYKGHFGAGNALIEMDLVHQTGAAFNLAYNAGGGEDTDFFWTLRERGAEVHWCDEAIAYEYVDADRLSPDWIRARARASASAFARIEAYHRGKAYSFAHTLARSFRLTRVAALLAYALRSRDDRRLRLLQVQQLGSSVAGGYLGIIKALRALP